MTVVVGRHVSHVPRRRPTTSSSNAIPALFRKELVGCFGHTLYPAGKLRQDPRVLAPPVRMHPGLYGRRLLAAPGKGCSRRD